ncbi:MAG: outer membrane protein [Gammaproteobacteria bacterium]
MKKYSIPLFLLSFAPIGTAQAEGDPIVFADVFGGYSWSQKQDLDFSTSRAGAPASLSFEDLDLSSGPVYGGRIGAWLITHPSFGIAVDATRFDTDIDNQTANINESSAVFMGSRVGSTGDLRITNVVATIDLILRHQGERFTPYVMAGPGLMFTNIDDKGGVLGLLDDDHEMTFAYKAGAGISYKLSDSMHLFTEYRYLHGGPEYEMKAQDAFTVPDSVTNSSVKVDIDTHVIVGGMSIRF